MRPERKTPEQSKRLISIRVSDATYAKVQWLGHKERYGTQTEAVAVALDRLYREEAPMHGISDSDIRAGLWAEYGHPDDQYTANVFGPEPDFDLPGQWRISFHQGDMPAFETQHFDEADSLRAAMRRIQPDPSAWHDYEAE